MDTIPDTRVLDEPSRRRSREYGPGRKRCPSLTLHGLELRGRIVVHYFLSPWLPSRRVAAATLGKWRRPLYLGLESIESTIFGRALYPPIDPDRLPLIFRTPDDEEALTADIIELVKTYGRY